MRMQRLWLCLYDRTTFPVNPLTLNHRMYMHTCNPVSLFIHERLSVRVHSRFSFLGPTVSDSMDLALLVKRLFTLNFYSIVYQIDIVKSSSSGLFSSYLKHCEIWFLTGRINPRIEVGTSSVKGWICIPRLCGILEREHITNTGLWAPARGLKNNYRCNMSR
jgi:hypothetical protein